MSCETAPEFGQDARAGKRQGLWLVKGPLGGPMETAAEPGSLEAALAADLDGSFERLVYAYQDRLFSFAQKLAASREDAEEIAQDAFVRAYRALKTYPRERIRALSLKAWLYRITLNLARNRARGKRPRFVSLDERAAGGDGRAAWEPEDDAGKRPDVRFEEERRRADIATLVAGLPDRYRAALILRYMEGLRLEEVAAVLKQPLGTTKSNVHRAVNLLREAISESRRAKRGRP